VFGWASSIGFSIGPFAGGVILDTFYHQDVLLWALIGMFGVAAAIGYTLLGRILGTKNDLAATEQVKPGTG
jgi:MFS family permease